MSDRIAKPKEHAKTQRRVTRLLKVLRAITRRQTAKLMKAARRIADGDAKPADLKPAYAAELKAAAKHLLVESFKEGRREMKKKIALGMKRAPASVRELWDPGEQILAAVRELDPDVLKYAEVAKEYETWAENVVGGTLKDTVDKAKDVVRDGIREGVPWNDYGWDKALGRNTKKGLRSQLQEIFDGYETWQLRRVGITEHTRAVGLGNVYEIDRDEMCSGGRWVGEYKVDPPCDQYNGNVYTTEVLRQIHPAHPNCQCTIDPVFVWEKERVREAA